jgi:hypothetical protein
VGLKRSVARPRDEFESMVPLLSTGLLGQSICDVVLVSMTTTLDMCGRLSGISWTQRSPIWMHRFSSNNSTGSDSGSGTIVVSRSSSILFCSHSPQACQKYYQPKFHYSTREMLYSVLGPSQEEKNEMKIKLPNTNININCTFIGNKST